MVEHEAQVGVIKELIETTVKKSYLDYAMSVLVGRALPSGQDGLKPVHRRILHAMNALGISSSKPTRKSARIVGECIGKYHPHGDVAVYDTLVRMAQDFSLRYPLIQGQGNFGSIDGDNAAAMRYTEARLTKLAEALLADIEKDTVDFAPNFDEQETEPVVLPSMFPNLLVNGSTGIAVGMATNMPPHNMTEICDAVLAYLEGCNEDVLYSIVKGPDFPTGGIIIGTTGIKSAYRTGRGKVIVRAKTHVEEIASRQRIIIDEIPYQLRKEDLLLGMDQCRRDKVIPDITLIRDESNKEGMRVVIELRQGAQTDMVLHQLYKHTRMQATFGIINLCLVDNIPRVLTLKELIEQFVKHRETVVIRRTTYELNKAKDKVHLLIGLKRAVESLDDAIRIIRGAKEAKQAKSELQERFTLDEKQAQAILDMRLQRLTGLERDKIVQEYENLLRVIKDLESTLADTNKIYAIIREETQQMRDQFGDERRTQLLDVELTVDDEDLIEDETVAVTITRTGFIKRVPVDTYRAQARGGKGIIGTSTRDEDVVEQVFTANTKSYVLCFSNTGQVYWLKVYKIPEASRIAQGRSIVNLLPLTEGERITAFIPVPAFEEGKYLVLATKKGTVKKTDLLAFSRPRVSGIRAITLDEDDELIQAGLTDGQQQIMLATRNGLVVRFSEENLRSMGRTAAGVRGIRLEQTDELVGLLIPQPNETVLTVTEHGYGKRTPVEEYRLIGRGGKGVINIQTSERNGRVVKVATVLDEDGLLLISRRGIIIRTRADQISVIGRNTQGVRLMRLEAEDVVSDVAKIVLLKNGDE